MKKYIIFYVFFVFVLDIKQILLRHFGQFTAGVACTIYFEILGKAFCNIPPEQTV